MKNVIMMCFHRGPLVLHNAFSHFFDKFPHSLRRICLRAKVHNLVFIICSLLKELIVWLINWKLYFHERKTRSFVLKFSPQNAKNCILGLWIFKIFWGLVLQVFCNWLYPWKQYSVWLPGQPPVEASWKSWPPNLLTAEQLFLLVAF